MADNANVATINSFELAQRVAVLRRFKALLTQQRDRFRTYLDLLEKQQHVIESGNAESLLAYVDVEEKVVADIFSIQKVIDPLEDMYHAVTAGNPPSADEVPSLKASLENLKNEAIVRSTRNKELLSKRMLELRSEIKNLRNNPYAARQTNFSDVGKASLIDIHG